jgi:hypothetical protein
MIERLVPHSPRIPNPFGIAAPLAPTPMLFLRNVVKLASLE